MSIDEPVEGMFVYIDIYLVPEDVAEANACSSSPVRVYVTRGKDGAILAQDRPIALDHLPNYLWGIKPNFSHMIAEGKPSNIYRRLVERLQGWTIEFDNIGRVARRAYGCACAALDYERVKSLVNTQL